jgi:hypothetical protein
VVGRFTSISRLGNNRRWAKREKSGRNNQPYFRQIRPPPLKILLSSSHPSSPRRRPLQLIVTPSPSALVNPRQHGSRSSRLILSCFCVLPLPVHPSFVRRAEVCPAPQPASRPNMVRTPFSLFDTAPILGVRKPSTFLGLPSISTHPSSWTASPAAKAPSYPYMNARPRYLRRSTTQSAKSISALERSFSPSKTIESLRMHRWSGTFPA